ncbi:hypothetical protein DBR22_03290 [Arthrobacter sp. HMWF013]|nr:hypothetical protein DBR22_03290 [Arthrobacter sp. HMWF013]
MAPLVDAPPGKAFGFDEALNLQRLQILMPCSSVKIIGSFFAARLHYEQYDSVDVVSNKKVRTVRILTQIK